MLSDGKAFALLSTITFSLVAVAQIQKIIAAKNRAIRLTVRVTEDMHQAFML
jgi:hypothetical protein